MAGTMSRADLAADLKASLHDAANVFTSPADADFSRMLDVSAQDMGRVRPRWLRGSLTVSAGVAEYAAPAGLVAFGHDVWGEGQRPMPWEVNYPGPHPRVSLAETASGKQLCFDPAPSALQVLLYGSAYPYYYRGGHEIGSDAANTTVAAADRGLLLLRAQAEAMRELAFRNVTKPVQLRDGLTGQPRISTPSFLHSALMEEFERRAT